MNLRSRIKISATIMLLACNSILYADAPPNVNTWAQNSNGVPANSNAGLFAVQAGSVAGAAQSCGQDVTVFSSRIGEAISKLSVNDADRVAAMAAYQQALQQAQQTQANIHPLACPQVTQDFLSLPIMRGDYEQTVISQLNPAMSGTGQPGPAAPPINQPYNQPAPQAMPPQPSMNPPGAPLPPATNYNSAGPTVQPVPTPAPQLAPGMQMPPQQPAVQGNIVLPPLPPQQSAAPPPINPPASTAAPADATQPAAAPNPYLPQSSNNTVQPVAPAPPMPSGTAQQMVQGN